MKQQQPRSVILDYQLRQRPSIRSVIFVVLFAFIIPLHAATLYDSQRLSVTPKSFTIKTIQRHLQRRQSHNRLLTSMLLLQQQVRGGSSSTSTSDMDEDDDDDGDNDTGSSSDQTPSESAVTTNKVSSSQNQLSPISLMIQTNIGSSLLDQIIELPMVNRQRTILSIKQSIQRQLYCKPPLSTIHLIYHGQPITDDNLLLSDVLDEDDDDDDDDDTNDDTDTTKHIRMYIDMIPPVDSKNFIYDIESKLDDITTSELLHAYATNEAAIYYNTQILNNNNNNDDDSIGSLDSIDNDASMEQQQKQTQIKLINKQIRDRAEKIQKDLQETVLHTKHARKILSDTISPKQKEILNASSKNEIEVRGERVRYVGINGIQGNYKRMIQHQLNIEDWYTTMKHCILFLFFGYFGGRTFVSRTLLLCGAPLMIICQTRIVKLYLRQILYTILYHPPSILLSLLPAPQQAILSLNAHDVIQSLYGKHIIIDPITTQLLEDDLDPVFGSLKLPSKNDFTKNNEIYEEEDEDDSEEDDDEDEDNEDDDDDDDE